jgi:hypothetical protein
VVLPLGVPGTYSVLQLPATTNGNVSPTSTLTLPAAIQFVRCIALDSSGQLYVAGYVLQNQIAIWEVLVYTAGASGSATPTRTIVTSFNQTFGPAAMAIDAAGSLYLASGTVIVVYASTANGLATPSRTITGPATQINGHGSLAVDASGNVYTDALVNDGVLSTAPPIFTVLEFPSTANGNVAPSHVISVPTGVPTGSNGGINAIATDTSGNVYFAGYTNSSLGTQRAYSIIEVAAGSSGTVTPLKTIAVESGDTPVAANGLRVDAAGNMYFEALISSPTSLPFVGAYAPTSSGTQSPTIVITSTALNSIASSPSIALK